MFFDTSMDWGAACDAWRTVATTFRGTKTLSTDIIAVPALYLFISLYIWCIILSHTTLKGNEESDLYANHGIFFIFHKVWKVFNNVGEKLTSLVTKLTEIGLKIRWFGYSYKYMIRVG